MNSTVPLVNGYALALGSPEEADTALSVRLEEIARLQNECYLIKTRRNALVPIGRLPPEVLAEVFLWLMYLHIESLPYVVKNCRSHHWLVVCLVCRHWRSVALSAPRLWSHILLKPGDTERTTVFLQRSGQTALTLRQYDPRESLPDEHLKLIFQQLYRAKALFCAVDETFVRFSETSSISAPLLENLSITASLPGTHTSFPTLATAPWPRLNRLECRGASFYALQALIRPTITSLSIHDSQQPTISWVTLLRELSDLRHLSLRNAVSPVGVPVSILREPVRRVTLPTLESLVLTDYAPETASADLLNHLIIPGTCRSQLFASNYLREADRHFFMAALLSKASGQGITGTVVPARGIYIDTWTFDGILINIYTEEDATLLDSSGNNPRYIDNLEPAMTIGLIAPSKKHVDCDLIESFLSTFPLSRVHAFKNCLFNPRRRSVFEAVSRLPALRQLELYTCVEEALAMLLDVLKSPTEFTGLELLVVHNMSVNRRHKSRRRQRDRVGSMMLLLMETLEARRAAGVKLKRLQLDAVGNISKKKDQFRTDVSRLRALVDHFGFSYGEDDEECYTCTESEDSGGISDGESDGEESEYLDESDEEADDEADEEGDGGGDEGDDA